MLDKVQQQILALRNHSMKKRKVLCTGNPDSKGTIASGVREIWPDTTFIHFSNGFDFLALGDKEKELENLFKTHNTFINASYVGGVQEKLLRLCNKNMTIGDVFNIGSTHEYDNLGDEDYAKNKIELRRISLELNSFRFQTCHIVMGGIDVGTPETAGWVKPVTIAETIKWITEQQIKIPIIGIDQPKQPW
tara:strand:+ start:1941 stop:2513 length:573 start_codon:yes stop_codon:yes gene_type:complete